MVNHLAYRAHIRSDATDDVTCGRATDTDGEILMTIIMNMKKVSTCMTATYKWAITLCICCLAMTAFTACGDDESNENKADDLAYLKQRISPEGDLVYGVYLGENTEVLNRPIQTEDEALKEFYKLLSGGSSHKGLKTEANGNISCRLTDANGKYQGTITFIKPQGEFTGYCAEVLFSKELTVATGLTRIRYILADMWPPGNAGFVTDILDKLKG